MISLPPLGGALAARPTCVAREAMERTQAGRRRMRVWRPRKTVFNTPPGVGQAELAALITDKLREAFF